MSAFKLHFGCLSVTGNYRENNEDRVYADPDLGLFIVADGMGGQLAGEKASQMAIEIIPEGIEVGLKSGGGGEKSIAEVICQSVLGANKEIMALSALRTEFQSMGTTVVLTLLREQTVYVAGIGDSRVYLARSGQLNQLTTDHSLAQALVDTNTISAEDALKHRFRNILWKYLGSKEVGSGPEVSILDALAGDRFLLATDGLTGVVSEEAMLRSLTEQPDSQKAAESLVEQALQNDSHDNVSCITVNLD